MTSSLARRFNKEEKYNHFGVRTATTTTGRVWAAVLIT